MIRLPPRSTRTAHSFPTRRSSDLYPFLAKVPIFLGVSDLFEPAYGIEQLLQHPDGRVIGEVTRTVFARGGVLRCDEDLLENFRLIAISVVGNAESFIRLVVRHIRSEERRVGNGCVVWCNTRGLPDHI